MSEKLIERPSVEEELRPPLQVVVQVPKKAEGKGYGFASLTPEQLDANPELTQGITPEQKEELRQQLTQRRAVFVHANAISGISKGSKLKNGQKIVPEKIEHGIKGFSIASAETPEAYEKRRREELERKQRMQEQQRKQDEKGSRDAEFMRRMRETIKDDPLLAELGFATEVEETINLNNLFQKDREGNYTIAQGVQGEAARLMREVTSEAWREEGKGTDILFRADTESLREVIRKKAQLLREWDKMIGRLQEIGRETEGGVIRRYIRVEPLKLPDFFNVGNIFGTLEVVIGEEELKRAKKAYDEALEFDKSVDYQRLAVAINKKREGKREELPPLEEPKIFELVQEKDGEPLDERLAEDSNQRLVVLNRRKKYGPSGEVSWERETCRVGRFSQARLEYIEAEDHYGRGMSEDSWDVITVVVPVHEPQNPLLYDNAVLRVSIDEQGQPVITDATSQTDQKREETHNLRERWERIEARVEEEKKIVEEEERRRKEEAERKKKENEKAGKTLRWLIQKESLPKVGPKEGPITTKWLRIPVEVSASIYNPGYRMGPQTEYSCVVKLEEQRGRRPLDLEKPGSWSEQDVREVAQRAKEYWDKIQPEGAVIKDESREEAVFRLTKQDQWRESLPEIPGVEWEIGYDLVRGSKPLEDPPDLPGEWNEGRTDFSTHELHLTGKGVKDIVIGLVIFSKRKDGKWRMEVRGTPYYDIKMNVEKTLEENEEVDPRLLKLEWRVQKPKK